MFNFLRHFNDSVKELIFNIIATIILVAIISLGLNFFSISKFTQIHKPFASKLYHAFKIDDDATNVSFVTQSTIIIKDGASEKLFKLENRSFESLEKGKILPHLLTYNIEENIHVEYPNYIVYTFEDATVRIETDHPKKFSIMLFSILFITTFILNILYALSMNKKADRMQNLKISAQEYALSERTTGYLVNIMHHKLNTPLKVLSTKSRMLVEAIVSLKSVPTEMAEKAEWDYVQIDESLKTIFSVTNKLKSYNELSQNEVNVYKLFTISKDTIDILKDDEFNLDIDYKTKLFDINKEHISSHEIIQIFINQIKFSLTQLSDKIGIRIFNHDNDYMTILYSDNGNIIPPELNKLLTANHNVSDVSNNEMGNDYFDLLLNFNILNESQHCNIRVLTSTPNGNVFEIKLPTFKHTIDTMKKIKAD